MTTLVECMQSYQDYIVHIRHLSEHTIKAYMHDLKLFQIFTESRSLRFEAIAFEDARRFVSRLQKKSYSEKSINRIISAVKSFYAYCITYEFAQTSPFSDVRSMRKQMTLPAVLTRDEVERIIDAPADTTMGIRDKTLFSMLYSTGCRLGELLLMECSDIQMNEGRVLVHGKGKRDRYVFLTKQAKELLQIYLPLRKQILLKISAERQKEKALFINKRGKRLTPQGVHYIFHTYVRMLGIDKHVTPHTFRHTFATHILDNDAGIRVVQELLGHQNISTTQIYSHVSTKRLKDVYKRSHPHGRRMP